MRNQLYVSAVALSLTLGAGACDDGSNDHPEDGRIIVDNTEISEEVTNRQTVDNGEELNGVSFNGISFNGISFNGISFNGISFNGISFNGISFNGISFNGISFNGSALGGLAGMFLGNVRVVKSKIEAVGTDGITYRGNSLSSTEIDMLVNGEPQRLRINSVVSDANDPDIQYTNLSRKKSDGTWETWCKDGYGNPTEAIIVEGAYDSNGNFLADNDKVAFACRGTASAKCIVWGYKPWESVGGVSLRNHYQACLAMVRGDYCRQNVPHTVNGTAIDISDHGLPAQIQGSGTNWPVEAQWGVNGAVCFNTPRKLIYPRNSINPCYSTIPNCPTDKNTWVGGALLMTQANPS